jgi:phospholipid/cholesterol/gamma-HCH transport system substrate-binding protein
MVMLSQRKIESLVGLFLLAAIFAMLVLAFKVSGLTSFFKEKSFNVTAQFDDIGQLKVRAPIKMGGVLVGEVAGISLDPTTFKAVVEMAIQDKFSQIPDDSTASVLTAGLLGDNYIALNPMYSQTFLKNGSELQDTNSAMILEKLIGQLIYKIGNPSPPETAPAPSTFEKSKPTKGTP